MNVIGWRKMAVLMWCTSCITVVLLGYMYKNQALTATDITAISLIAGLGGYHVHKQHQIDSK